MQALPDGVRVELESIQEGGGLAHLQDLAQQIRVGGVWSVGAVGAVGRLQVCTTGREGVRARCTGPTLACPRWHPATRATGAARRMPG